MHKTVFDADFRIIKADYDFNYQNELTFKLDGYLGTLDQNIINEIVLWKVNRYALLGDEALQIINSLDNTTELDVNKTKQILQVLLLTKGVGLPMASTILKFRNKNIYQIIDQRVYRVIYKDKKLQLNGKDINLQIETYLKYLSDLEEVCRVLNIDFTESDRILYMVDKRINKGHSLNNY